MNNAADILGLKNLYCKYCNKKVDCVKEQECKDTYGSTYKFSICADCYNNVNESIVGADLYNKRCTAIHNDTRYIKVYG